MSRGVESRQCARCGELEARFLDPETPNPGAFLYRWATHHLDDHGTRPGPREGCAECDTYAENAVGVHSVVWERWRQTHYMQCALAPDWKPRTD
ncbi:hypothetical protein VSR01_31355 [Actinacidiphila sp. DG2A-62]|uniref:hypothetical protein n=1 Tax=Actinacidiphila sp. DG2A-62 TaxID=3108821 RepID=UPI002DBD3270|nr:hypothetical protein [Actinacidiphila sp. DG2A-62]MEC3997747.1 hypothetical protein [Actinacidiphila sp. DG2A-62]